MLLFLQKVMGFARDLPQEGARHFGIDILEVF